MNYKLTHIEDHELPGEKESAAMRLQNAPWSSTRTGPETELVFVNQTKGTVELTSTFAHLDLLHPLGNMVDPLRAAVESRTS